ncbi:hypothetical protein TNCV_2840901 [Trichonephila clavipes]|uniref:Uncharacterized protein n=1 Tax=Trichonephila clavipes TaxID=2585209 RepID=A0A8X6RW47_TRICX|nr:hypothetical protein TNCV_2840901 [Trichonephila clavipes]
MRWFSPTLSSEREEKKSEKKRFLPCLKVNLQDWTHRTTASCATNGALFGGKIYDIANNNVFHAALESGKSMSGFDWVFTNGTVKSR